MTVQNDPGHKPEAQAKDPVPLRLRLRLVCCRIVYGHFRKQEVLNENTHRIGGAALRDGLPLAYATGFLTGSGGQAREAKTSRSPGRAARLSGKDRPCRRFLPTRDRSGL